MVALNVIPNKDSGRRTELIGRWPINIGATPTHTEHKMIRRWPIDIGAAPKTQTDMTNDPSI